MTDSKLTPDTIASIDTIVQQLGGEVKYYSTLNSIGESSNKIVIEYNKSRQ